MKLPFGVTVRARLALLLAALVVATGAVLLPTSYLLVRANILAALNHALAVGQGQSQGQSQGGTPPAPPPGGGVTHEVTLSQSVVGSLMSTLLGEYGVILAALVVLAGALAWLGAGRMLRPLRQITDTARRITGEDLHERLALGGPADELTELGDTFDAMLARLETAFTAQQLFAANAAHELRTPLAVMRAELDLLLTGPRPAPAEVHDTATRLRRAVLGTERMLERLLTLTRGMLAPAEREPVSLDHVVSQALAAAAETARAQRLTVRSRLRDARADGDPSLLAEMTGNLVQNAVRYNRPDGWISADTHTDGDHVVLEISNSGPQVDHADLDRLVEPFHRAGQQRTGHGSGLGLSIVRAIVLAHHGELGLQALPGGGLTVRATLPAAPPDHGA